MEVEAGLLGWGSGVCPCVYVGGGRGECRHHGMVWWGCVRRPLPHSLTQEESGVGRAQGKERDAKDMVVSHPTAIARIAHDVQAVLDAGARLTPCPKRQPKWLPGLFR